MAPMGVLCARAALALLLAAAALPLPVAGQQFRPGPVTVTVGNLVYDVTTTYCSSLSGCDGQLRASAVWGNDALARSMAEAVGGLLGSDTSRGGPDGPLFPHRVGVFLFWSTYYSWYRYIGGNSNIAAEDAGTAGKTVALVSAGRPRPSPSPSPRTSPSPSPAPIDFLPGPINVTVNEVTYSVTTVPCSTLASCDAQMRASAAWGKLHLAASLSAAVGSTLGTRKPPGAGPFFVHRNSSTSYFYSIYSVAHRVVGNSSQAASFSWTIAVAAELPVPSSSPQPLAPGYVAEPAAKAVEGVNYTVKAETCAPVSRCGSQLKKSATWGNRALAEKLARAVSAELGSDNATGAAPAFVYGGNDTGYAALRAENGSVTEFIAAPTEPLTFAESKPPPSPEPSPEPTTPLASGFVAEPAAKAVGGIAYTVELETCATLSACDTKLREAPVWGKKALAKELARKVGAELGSDTTTGAGPAIVYDVVNGSYASFGVMNGSVTEFRLSPSDPLTVARVAESLPQPPPEPPTPLASGYVAEPATKTVDGMNYTVQAETCASSFDCDTKLRKSATWNNRELAEKLAHAISAELGSDNAIGAGPAFVYSANDTGYAALRTENGSLTEFLAPPGEPLTVAQVAESLPPASPSPSPEASPEPSPEPSPSPSPEASTSPSPEPSPSPSASPSPSPSESPSESPSTSPSASPSASPSESPRESPSPSPSMLPSASPSELPSPSPIASPSPEPSPSPIASPSASPSASPIASPSESPRESPSSSPSASPSASPIASPSASPSVSPIASPIASPSMLPSASPSPEPPTPLASGFEAEPAAAAVGGANYTVELETCATLSACDAKLQESVVWGNKTLARELAEEVAAKLGSDDATGAGPAFVYGADDSGYAAVGIKDGSVADFVVARSVRLTVARVAVGLPKPRGSPSPSPGLQGPQPPMCTGRAVSVTSVDVQTNSQLCRLRKMATRKNNPMAVGTVVTAASFNDPAGNPVSIIFTGATANRMGGASCHCSRAQRSTGGCACVPDAVISRDRTSVRLLPLRKAVDATRREVATTVRLHFNATVPTTGLACSGVVDICAQRLTRRGTPVRSAPTCGEFGATRAVRDLTVCSG